MLMHWAPTWVTAGVCKPSYLPDIIMHLENIESEFKSLLGKLGLQSSEYRLPLIIIRGTNPIGDTKEDDYKTYFSQLSKDQVYSLYQLYSLDFELYGYSPQKYMEYAH
ncbi:carbohydrate sulfotransferase 10-like [Eurytemora carolleeae]|uniref:carbohydrate sulfotransferase 10-like n=1 Tax=Eurytemora carolleeae TaxID=1294199 RepID=UPI000C787210|nr:carbohydrate sulfotransferase 10-like [Eurytemora carolleeae]|eukprot:XP_023342090.1 carbohydrate sulfotransferase 10-like [Eurytemora affinis]